MSKQIQISIISAIVLLCTSVFQFATVAIASNRISIPGETLVHQMDDMIFESKLKAILTGMPDWLLIILIINLGIHFDSQ